MRPTFASTTPTDPDGERSGPAQRFLVTETACRGSNLMSDRSRESSGNGKRRDKLVRTPGVRQKPGVLGKQAFDVKAALRGIREAVKPYPNAALFELASEGFNSIFEQ